MNVESFIFSIFSSRSSSHNLYSLTTECFRIQQIIFQYLGDLTANFTIHICVVKHKLVLIVMF